MDLIEFGGMVLVGLAFANLVLMLALDVLADRGLKDKTCAF